MYREYRKRVRSDQPIGAYRSAEEPDSVTMTQIDPPPTCMSSVPSNPKAGRSTCSSSTTPQAPAARPLAGACAMKGGQ